MSTRISHSLITLALCLLTLPLFAETTPWGQSESSLQETIEGVYAKYEGYSSPAVRFSLSDFRTIYPESFRQVRLLEVADVPGGLLLESLAVESDNGESPDTVLHEVEWILEEEHPWIHDPGGEELYSLSLDDALHLAAIEEPALATAQGITTFQVAATMGNATRAYRAAFLWLPGNPKFPRVAEAFVADGITDGLARVADEDNPAGPPQSLPVVPNDCDCTETETKTDVMDYDSDTTEHTSGKHFANVHYKLVCKCDQYCNTTLSWEKVKAKCKDRGGNGLFRSHRIATKIKKKGGFGAKAKAKGHIAYACAVTSCPLGIFCRGSSISITLPGTIQGQPGSATATFTGTNIWEYEWDSPGECGACGTGAGNH
ncbi:MAG: hypothetical protein AAF657_31245 [Acidobacteriota bacterium]